MKQAQVISFTELHGSAPQRDAAVPRDIDPGNPLHQVSTTLNVCVGRATMTIGELLAAQHEHVIALDTPLDAPVDILLEGQVVARGQLIAVGDNFGVRITELPQPLKV